MNSELDFYNCKVLDYGNGIVQFRIYQKPIIKGFARKLKEYTTDSYEFTTEDYLENVNDDVLENPFLDNSDLQKLADDEKAKLEYKKHMRSIDVSAKRSKEMIYRYSMSNQWEWFFTFTFNPDLVDSFDYDACLQKLRIWLNHQRQRKAPDLMYLCIPEQHKSGRWHFHGLLSNLGSMQLTDSGHKSKGDIIYNVSGFKWGFTTATVIKDTHKASSYIMKYITKSLCGMTMGKRRYINSKNLSLPVEEETMVDSNFFTDLLSEVGSKVLYTKLVEFPTLDNQVNYITIDQFKEFRSYSD